MLSAAAAAMVLSGCSKSDTEELRPAADLQIKAGAIAATPESRAYIGEQDGTTYPMLWAETGETFAILELADPDYEKDYTSRKVFINPTAYTVTNANRQANFSFELTKNETAKRFDYFVCSPASAFFSLTPAHPDANLNIPAEQTPALTSADPAASILFAYVQNLTAQPTEASPLTLQFKHVVAYGKMTIKALAATAGTIKTVTFTGNKSENLAGGYYYYYSGETGNPSTYNPTSTLTLDMSALNLDATKPFDVWFACKPVELPYGYKVTVTTSDNTKYTRKVDAGTLKFEAGKISQFGVLMNKLSEPDLGIDNTTASSFTASWKPVANATEYAWKVAAANDPNAIVKSGTTTETTLTVSDGLTAGASYVLYVKAIASTGFVDSEYAVSNEFVMEVPTEPVVIFLEDFAEITAGNNTSSSGSNSAWNGNANFPTVEVAYQAGGAVRIGSSKKTGSITSTPLNLSSPFKVTVKVKGWSSVEGNLVITVGAQTKEIDYTETMSGEFGEYSVDFNAETDNSTIKIATSAKRAFIDEVKITK